MSFFKKLFPLLLVGLCAVGVMSAPAQAQNISSGVIIDAVDLEGLDLVEGVLTATGGTVSGTIGGLPFTTELTNFQLEFIQPPGELGCSILDLELAPIHLNLLGLHVDTSPICLSITAFPDQGLLGDLLCSLSGILDGLLNLDQVTDILEGDLLEDILSGALTDALSQAGDPPSGAEDICEGECEVLDLAIGPVDLTVLGLNVHLDDCENGPVQVCVSASEGELLGDLLCGLAGGGILPDLGAIEDLIDAIEDILNLDLTDQQLNRLVRLVGRLLGDDGVLDDKDLDKVAKEVDKVLRKQ